MKQLLQIFYIIIIVHSSVFSSIFLCFLKCCWNLSGLMNILPTHSSLGQVRQHWGTWVSFSYRVENVFEQKLRGLGRLTPNGSCLNNVSFETMSMTSLETTNSTLENFNTDIFRNSSPKFHIQPQLASFPSMNLIIAIFSYGYGNWHNCPGWRFSLVLGSWGGPTGSFRGGPTGRSRKGPTGICTSGPLGALALPRDSSLSDLEPAGWSSWACPSCWSPGCW